MPATQAKLNAIKEAEEKLDIAEMVESSLKAAQIIEI